MLYYWPRAPLHYTNFVVCSRFCIKVTARNLGKNPSLSSAIHRLCAVAGMEMEDYPKPLSPPPPQMSRQVEYERAMRAEAAVQAGPAICRHHIIFEDPWIVAVNKPSGVYCEHVLSSMNQLLASAASSGVDNGGKPLELHLANRLDRDTSGVMIITKLHKVAAKFVKAFTEHKVRKSYLALCSGEAPKWNDIYITSGHGRSKFGAWRVYSKEDVGRVLPGGSTVRQMSTVLQVLSVNGCKIQHKGNLNDPEMLPQLDHFNKKEHIFDHFNDSLIERMDKLEATEHIGTNFEADSNAMGTEKIKSNDEIIIRAFPMTGRTHQIRLHCQYVGLPIIGDVRYEGALSWKGKTFEGHALHAETVCFEHPVTGNHVQLDAPLPNWALKYL